ncbi:hypothetical protein CVT24_006881 [Panaeolus cyanescens]|uniref:Uncharacterized protein n=1 Tax=Panaeolus cyanescens TaxID=181874 RepID=A0A409YWY8_9AGAR|nr:hypothetical protein CVT24_006881 [Panaeolus cyanescens]
MNDNSNELVMEPEIHDMLRNYSCANYTTSYILFTEAFTTEFILNLKTLPLVDFGCLTVLPDPYSTLSQILSLSTLPAYDEEPQTTKDGLAYLKRELAIRGAKPKPRTFNDGPEITPPPERFLPIVTRKSQKKTPLFNKSMNTFRTESAAALFESQNIVRMEEPEEAPLIAEEILELGFKLEENTATSVRALLQSTANMVRPYKGWKNPHIDPKTMSSFPEKPYYIPPEEFCPMFPRVPPVKKKVASKKKSVSFAFPLEELGVSLGPVSNPPSTPDLYRENLVIVDGWETILSSPLSTSSTQEDEIDELDPISMPSTPLTEPLALEEIIIPVEIPRSRQIGGTQGLTPHLLKNQTQPKVDGSPEAQPPENQTNSPNSSMVGHASSRVASKAGKGPYDLSDDLDEDLRRIYADQPSPHKLILNEHLDDINSMMEVPDLPEPNIHGPNPDFLLPTSFSRMVKPKDDQLEGGSSKRMDHFSFLEKAKGQRALAISLSWVSFTTTEKLPTIPQIVGVDEIDVLGRIQPEVERVLAPLLVNEDHTPIGDQVARQDDYESTYVPPSWDGDFQLLLNRQELKRIAKRNGDAHISSDRDEGNDNPDDATSHAHKRPRLDDQPQPRQPQRVLASQDLPPSSPPLLTPSDDSGIVINDKIRTSDYQERTPPPNGQYIQDQPPFSSYLSYTTGSPQSLRPNDVAQATQLDYDYRDYDDLMDFEAETFMPLSMESYPLNAAPPVEQPIPPWEDPSIERPKAPEAAPPFHESLIPLENSRLAQNSLISVFDFARLRGKRVSAPVAPIEQAPAPQPDVEHPIAPCRAPAEIVDKNTLRLPDLKLQPASGHRYLGSLDLIQKRGLVLALQSPHNQVDIAERESLDGADLVLDPYSAIIFFSLFTLPARSEAYLARVCAQSWKYKTIYVIFEAFPESWARLTNKRDEVSEVSAYTPHIMKAIRRFRRDVEVAAACGTRDAGCGVKYAFADTVDEAAEYVRMCGDIAEKEDVTDGQLWTLEREWMLWKDQHDEERELANADGMNPFSAALLLCNDSLDALINMSPEHRLEQYADYIGREAVVKLNASIQERLASLQEELEISTSDIH